MIHLKFKEIYLLYKEVLNKNACNRHRNYTKCVQVRNFSIKKSKSYIVFTFSTNISKKSIIDVVQCYLEKNNVRPNSVISNFDHPILHNDVKTIIVGDVPNYVSIYLLCFFPCYVFIF